MSDSENDNTSGLLRIFRVKAEGMPAGSSVSYVTAVASLTAFVRTLPDSSDIFSLKTLSDWLVSLCVRGFTLKTATLYLDALSGLYKSAVAEGEAVPSDVFKTLRAGMKAAGKDFWTIGVDPHVFDRLVALTKSLAAPRGNASTGVDLLLFHLLNGCMPLAEMAALRKEDIGALDDESREIALRQADPRRRYVFPLRQADRTPRQLMADMRDMMAAQLEPHGIRLSGTPEETLAPLWALAALRCGIPASDVASILGDLARRVPVLALSPAGPLDSPRREDIVRMVAKVFAANPLQWYAMRLRPSVRYDEVTARIGSIKDERVSPPPLFYPSEEIARRTGRRLVYEKKPLIADVVFFRSRVTDICPLFAHIGDIAWCYTLTGRPGGPYAAIPRQAFERFQQTIGQFTPDYEVAPIGTLSPGENEKIVVVGGLFRGREASFLKMDSADRKSVV